MIIHDQKLEGESQTTPDPRIPPSGRAYHIKWIKATLQSPEQHRLPKLEHGADKCVAPAVRIPDND
eukprot:2518906-Prorocentrum_lima.AAC.1